MRRSLTIATLLAALALTAPPAGAVTIDEFPLGATPTGITAGPDGNMYVTTKEPSVIQVRPSGDVGYHDSLHTSTDATTTPSSPVFSGATLWYVIEHVATSDGTTTLSLGRRLAGGTTTELPIPATALAPDAHGGVWFTGTNVVGHVNAAGAVDRTIPLTVSPTSIATDPNGRVWLAGGPSSSESTAGVLDANGTISGTNLRRGALEVATSPASATVWFLGGDRVCCLTGQLLANFAYWLPSDSSGVSGIKVTGGWLATANAQDVAVGPDDNAWMTDQQLGTTPFGGVRIGRVSATGRITTFTTGLSSDAMLDRIARGPGDTVWFTDKTDRVGRIKLDRPSTTTEGASEVSQTGASVGATVIPRGTDARVRFVYGTTTAYGAATRWQEAGDGDDPVSKLARLGGLSAGTTYHYRAEINSSWGIIAGADRTLTTAAIPPPPPSPPADADGDGYAVSVDCDDRAASVYPGAPERPGDRIDEDCNGSDAQYERFFPHVVVSFQNKQGKWSRATELAVQDLPAGAHVALSCRGKGCPFRSWSSTVRRAVDLLDLKKRLKGSKLTRGVILELQLTLDDHVGTVIRWRIGPPPKATVTCLEPGSKKDHKC